MAQKGRVYGMAALRLPVRAPAMGSLVEKGGLGTLGRPCLGSAWKEGGDSAQTRQWPQARLLPPERGPGLALSHLPPPPPAPLLARTFQLQTLRHLVLSAALRGRVRAEWPLPILPKRVQRLREVEGCTQGEAASQDCSLWLSFSHSTTTGGGCLLCLGT